MKTIKNILPVGLILGVLLFNSCTNKKVPDCCKNKMKDTTSSKTESTSDLSIYQLNGTWETQNNQQINLTALKGKIQVLTMFFSNCTYACPRIVNNLKNIEKEIPANLIPQVGFTLVSFDTKRDTVARLKAFAKEMKLDGNWTLLHGDENEVRELSMLLNVDYQKQSDGNFAHASVINVLDKDGKIIFRHEGLDSDSTEVVQKIISALK
ncbi:MAG: SCO family protein [Bacteroidia bacterium]